MQRPHHRRELVHLGTWQPETEAYYFELQLDRFCHQERAPVLLLNLEPKIER
jgi:hypothetical protein